MIDFIKIETASRLLDKPGIYNLASALDPRTVILPNYKGLEIKTKPQRTFIQNSIHSASKGNNYSDYNLSELWSSIVRLCKDLELNPKFENIRSIEFGINQVLPPYIPVNKFLKHSVMYKGEPIPFERWANGAIQLKMEQQQYEVKMYEKGTQNLHINPLVGDVLRYEIHVNKMHYLNKVGIKTLYDLLNPSKIFQLITYLEQVYKNIVFLDWSVDTSQMSKPEEKLWSNWSNPRYIDNLYKTDRAKYKYEKQKFDEITNKYTRRNIKETVWNLLQKKWYELMYIDLKSYTKLTDYLSTLPGFDLYLFNTSSLGLIQYSFIAPDLMNYLKENTTKSTGLLCCKITGKPIAHQKPNSKFLSAKEIGYYEAHRLRNIDSNPRNKLRYKLEKYKGGNELFPIGDTLTLTPDQVATLEHWRGTPYDILTQLNY